ncbi:hypothetical protein F4824DRAFT_480855 [Ustulina deusta]|nr:hypothetical protein F4823DRAFT_34101 [Ustulina deusta]KAI3329805.1 hypothetical protein F4824DRAFT_480855 [Ustulina deusta]
MAVNSRSLRVVPPPVPDDVKNTVRAAETAATGVHASGQDAGMQSNPTPKGSAPKVETGKELDNGRKDVAMDGT